MKRPARLGSGALRVCGTAGHAGGSGKERQETEPFLVRGPEVEEVQRRVEIEIGWQLARSYGGGVLGGPSARVQGAGEGARNSAAGPVGR